jgi:cytochrome P450
MSILVSELDLPFIPPKLIKSDLTTNDQFQIGLEAHKQSWIGTTNISYVILDHKHSSTMLKDKRWHNALYLLSELNPHFTEEIKISRKKLIINLEGEDHSRLRKIIAPVFSPKTAELLRPDMQNAINEVINDVIESGQCDLQKDVFNRYPSYIISKIVGVPNSHWEKFSQWADDTFKTFSGNFEHDSQIIINTQNELDEYTRNLIISKKQNKGNDLVSMLIDAESDGEKLLDSEIQSLVQVVLMAGIDTTRAQLGLIAIILSERPDLISMLANDINVEDIIEECTRLDSVFKYVMRIASEDIEYNGVLFPKGTIITPALNVGNYDESVFQNGSDFVLGRTSTKGTTLAYAGGIHYCLGASLARAQMQECMKVIAKRIPDYKITGQVVHKEPNEAVVGPKSIPITFTPGVKI